MCTVVPRARLAPLPVLGQPPEGGAALPPPSPSELLLNPPHLSEPSSNVPSWLPPLKPQAASVSVHLTQVWGQGSLPVPSQAGNLWEHIRSAR